MQVVEFIDDKNLSWVLEIIIPFFKLIVRRLPSIESQRYSSISVNIFIKLSLKLLYISRLF